MKEVIYVDVLFILNFFVTYLLLVTTKYLLKRDAKLWRLLLSAIGGGAYSLIILIENLNEIFSFVGKFACAAVLVAIAFSFQSWKAFLKGVLFFFGAGFIYVGVMIAMWLTFRPAGLVIHNATIYFNISPKLLIISALLAYLVSTLLIKLHNRVTAKNQLYSLSICHADLSISLCAFVDTGNKLKEPFSGAPVIVVDASLAQPLFIEQRDKMRVIPCHTIQGEGMLQAYQADKVIITSGRQKIVLSNQYIALSKEPLSNGEFSALINPEILNI